MFLNILIGFCVYLTISIIIYLYCVIGSYWEYKFKNKLDTKFPITNVGTHTMFATCGLLWIILLVFFVFNELVNSDDDWDHFL